MYEADLYGPIKGELEKLLSTKGRGFGLEMTAAKAPSENLKSKIPQHREIVFAFLKKRPDIFGFVEGQYSVDHHAG